MRDRLMELAHSYQREHNELMLEFMKEKDVASMSGRLLNRWGRVKKPQLIARIERLEQQAQITITACQSDHYKAHLLVGLIMEKQ